MSQASLDNAVSAETNIDWSISVRDSAGHELARHHADRPMQIASVGKLLLLVEVARQCHEGTLSGTEHLSRDPELVVADSGIWQHLLVDALPIQDLCVLIASVSDNVATNVLLKRVGLPRIRDLCASLGLAHTALLDYIRDQRGPGVPATCATGSAAELSRLMSQLHRGELLSRSVSAHVNGWLAASVDLSMVASAFGLDPLSHASSDDGFCLRNKTGTDAGIRADVGTVGRIGVWFSYAVIANWDTSEPGRSDTALSVMNAIGRTIKDAIPGPATKA